MNRCFWIIAVLCLFLALPGYVLASSTPDEPIEIHLTEDGSEHAKSGVLTISETLMEEISQSDIMFGMCTQYGIVTLFESGVYRYTPDARMPAVWDAREQGVTLTDAFGVVYDDIDGNRRILNIRVDIAPNDHAQRGENAAHMLTHPEQAVEGRVDMGAAASQNLSFATEYGALHLGSNGEYRYELDNTLRAVQALSQGQTTSEAITVCAILPDDSIQKIELHVIITGQNDIPAVRNFIYVLTADDPQNKITGNALNGSVAGDGWTEQHKFSWISSNDSSYGNAILRSNGTYSYTLDSQNADVQALGEDDSLKEIYNYRYTDADGDQDIGTLKILIYGVGKVPTIGDATNNVSEHATAAVTGDVLTGNYALGNGTFAQHTFAWDANQSGNYGTIALHADGTYSYMPDQQNADVRALGENDTLTETFIYSFTDKDEDEDTGTLTITIQGADDTPSIGNVSFSISDVNTATIKGDVKMQFHKLGDGTLDQHIFAWDDGQSGTYGTIVLNPDGTYSYTLDKDIAAAQALTVDAKLTETFTYSFADKDGDQDTAELVITIYGLDRFPTIGDATNSIFEDTESSITGNVLENNHTLGNGTSAQHTFLWTSEESSSVYGSVLLNSDGTYSYRIDNTMAAVQALGEGDTLTDSFTYSYEDEDGDKDTGTLAITIQGTDDSPTIGDAAYSIYNNKTNINSRATWYSYTLGDGTIEEHTFQFTSTQGTVGCLILHENGSYTYTAWLEDPNFLFLSVGEKIVETFSYKFTDKDGDYATGTLTITILGTK